MISLDIINEKQITAEVSGDEIVINVLKFAVGAGGVTTYDALTDTPATKTGQAGKNVRVNLAETLHEYDKQFQELITLADNANITVDLADWKRNVAKLENTTQVAINLTINNFIETGAKHLQITKNNSDLDLTFTLISAGVVFDVFDPANNVNTEATQVVISGTDLDQSWTLSFVNAGMTRGGDTVIQVVGTIDSFS